MMYGREELGKVLAGLCGAPDLPKDPGPTCGGPDFVFFLLLGLCILAKAESMAVATPRKEAYWR